MTKPTDQEIATALNELISAALAHREAQRSKRKGQPVGFWAVDFDTLTIPSLAEEIVADPIGEAIELAVRELGKHLNEEGGFARMQAVSDLVEDMNPNSSAPGSYLDHRWDGIGTWWA